MADIIPRPATPTSLDQQHHAPGELTDPFSGEVLDCTNPETAAAFIEGLRLFKMNADKLIKQASEILAEEMGRRGKNKIVAGEWMAERSAKRSTRWDDIEGLRVEMLEAGAPPELLDELIVTTVEEKPNATVANRLTKANPAYAEVIERHRIVTEDGYSVSTKPLQKG